METLSQDINFVGYLLKYYLQELAQLQSPALTASIIALSAMFTVPHGIRQLLTTIGILGVGIVTLFAPSYAMILYVIACGFIGVARSRRRSFVLQKQIDRLARVVHELELAENARLMQQVGPQSLPPEWTSPRAAPAAIAREQLDRSAESADPHNVKSLHRA